MNLYKCMTCQQLPLLHYVLQISYSDFSFHKSLFHFFKFKDISMFRSFHYITFHFTRHFGMSRYVYVLIFEAHSTFIRTPACMITVPESPRGFSAMALNSSSVLLTWRRPTDREAKGIIRGYQIFRSELGENGERITDPILNYVS